MMKYFTILLLISFNPIVHSQQCDTVQSPLNLIEEYISNPLTDISYTHFLNTIINQFGEFTKIDSRLYREEITDAEITCLSRFVSTARDRTSYHIKNSLYCLSPNIQLELGVAPIIPENIQHSQYDCLENMLNDAKLDLDTINRDADKHCYSNQ